MAVNCNLKLYTLKLMLLEMCVETPNFSCCFGPGLIKYDEIDHLIHNWCPNKKKIMIFGSEYWIFEAWNWAKMNLNSISFKINREKVVTLLKMYSFCFWLLTMSHMTIQSRHFVLPCTRKPFRMKISGTIQIFILTKSVSTSKYVWNLAPILEVIPQNIINKNFLLSMS